MRFGTHLTRAAVALTSLLAAGNLTADVKAFIGARIISGTSAAEIPRATLVIEDGRVKAVGPSDRVQVPAGAQKIDVAGKTIMPGMINSHGHVGETQGLRSGSEFYTEENLLRQLGLYGRYGVTSVFSLGGDREIGFRLRDQQNTPALNERGSMWPVR